MLINQLINNNNNNNNNRISIPPLVVTSKQQPRYLIFQIIKLSSFILHLFYVFNHLFAVAIIASGLRTVQNLRRLDTLFLQ